jgi:voltage-gated potassium channel
MRSPSRRILIGGTILAVTVVAATIAYRLLGWTWLEAVYMVVITVGTVGYGERSQISPAGQLVTIGLIVVGIAASGYTLGGLLQLLAEGELERYLGRRRMTREAARLNDHVIVCGYGRLGRVVCDELRRKNRSVVVIDVDETLTSAAIAAGHVALAGDAADEAVLKAGGIDRARFLVAALPNDAQNVFITLTARNMNPNVRVIARGEQPTTERKLLQAGAQRVVLPASIGGQRIAAMVTKPALVELLEIGAGATALDIEVDEHVIASGTPDAETTIEAFAARHAGLLILALRPVNGAPVFKPTPETKLAAGDTLYLVGPTEVLARLAGGGAR